MGLASYATHSPLLGEGTHFPIHLLERYLSMPLAAPKHSFLTLPARHYCKRVEMGTELGSLVAVGGEAEIQEDPKASVSLTTIALFHP